MNVRMSLILAILGTWVGSAEDLSAQNRTTPRRDSTTRCTDVSAVDHSGVLSPDGEVSAVSGTTYGSRQCPGHFVLEASWNAPPHPSVYTTSAGAAWADAELPEQSCKFALVSASFHGYKPGDGRNRAGWVNLGTKSAGGKWFGFENSKKCSVSVGIEFDPTQYTKLRVVAKASTALGGVKKLRARVGSIRIPV